jgi:carboxyl-terminal processing protease
VINKVSVQFIDQNREDLKRKFSTFDKFEKEFSVDDDFLQQLIQAGEKENIPFQSAQFDTSRELIKLQLKALVARDLWDINAYYQIIDNDNEVLKKAVELLQTPDAYEQILK